MSRMVIATMILACLGCDPPVSPTSATSPAVGRFLALGDSYTIGEGVPEADRWPNQLARMLRARGVADLREVQIIATTGWTTDELSAAIDQRDPRPPFQLVSLLIGVNNQYRGRSVESFRPEFAALLRRAITFAGGDVRRVIVVSIPDWGVMPFAADRDRGAIAREIDNYNAACREVAQRAGVRFVNVTEISRQAGGDPAMSAEDGLHPSGEQYQLWTKHIADALSDLPAPR